MNNSLARLRDATQRHSAAAKTARVGGTVVQIGSDSCQLAGLSNHACIGDLVEFELAGGLPFGQVVHVDQTCTTVRAFQSLVELNVGARVWQIGPAEIRPHPSWRGRTLNSLGRPIDGNGLLQPGPEGVRLEARPPAALQRGRVLNPLRTGVRVIDLFTPLCNGQRIGIFSGSGIGKSTLLQMLARAPDFDTTVICLVGERGREVREFLEDGLGPVAQRCVSVIATGDESTMMRRLAPSTAMSIAEYFRDLGDNVLFLTDSITRFAHAARDIAISTGEPPVQRGYPPSVFADIARLLERAGPGADGAGTITGIFSVLVDGDDHDDPVADSIRGILDGHVVLDRKIAEQGRYPAIDPLRSVSRLARHVWSPEQEEFAQSMRALIARYEDTSDLRMIGGYQAGSDAKIDQAVTLAPALYDFLRQSLDQPELDDVFAKAAATLREGMGLTEVSGPNTSG
ncbi:MAG: FliI/YscN family ATPase [Hyphomicrobiaceae bacterium]